MIAPSLAQGAAPFNAGLHSANPESARTRRLHQRGAHFDGFGSVAYAGLGHFSPVP